MTNRRNKRRESRDKRPPGLGQDGKRAEEEVPVTRTTGKKLLDQGKKGRRRRRERNGEGEGKRRVTMETDWGGIAVSHGLPKRDVESAARCQAFKDSGSK
jgi:hypothetical protein